MCFFETEAYAHVLDEEGNPITTEETVSISIPQPNSIYSRYIINTASRMLPTIIAVVILYLILVRPQRSREKKGKSKIDNIEVGDTASTIGGICGIVTAFDYNYVYMEIGVEGGADIRPVIKVKREAIESIEKKA